MSINEKIAVVEKYDGASSAGWSDNVFGDDQTLEFIFKHENGKVVVRLMGSAAGTRTQVSVVEIPHSEFQALLEAYQKLPKDKAVDVEDEDGDIYDTEYIPNGWDKPNTL